VRSQRHRAPKTKAMAKLSRLTVALHIYTWNATVKLPGTRWAGGYRVAGTGWLVWLVAVPCLPAVPPPDCPALPWWWWWVHRTGCARWLSVSCAAELSCAGRSR